MIARTVNVAISASSKQTESPFSLPGQSAARVVLLEATVDSDPAHAVRLRARVQFDDSGSLPGRSATVLDWVVLR
jgi:hypothetical protein